jgi:hypothetical protein
MPLYEHQLPNLTYGGQVLLYLNRVELRAFVICHNNTQYWLWIVNPKGFLLFSTYLFVYSHFGVHPSKFAFQKIYINIYIIWPLFQKFSNSSISYNSLEYINNHTVMSRNRIYYNNTCNKIIFYIRFYYFQKSYNISIVYFQTIAQIF